MNTDVNETFGPSSSIANVIEGMKDLQAVKTPENVKIKSSMNSGELIVNLKWIKRAAIYYFEYVNESIPGVVVSKRESFIDRINSYTFTNLTPGLKYRIRIGISPTVGQVQYSEYFEVVCE